MLVLDASVVAELLVGSPIGIATAERAGASAGELHVPHLAGVETASVLRAWVARRQIAEHRAAGALIDLAELPVRRWPVEPFLGRIWELRDNMSAYDAAYVALAEVLEAELVTADRRLARAVDAIATCRVVDLGARG
jgi:predicted nucleic acid-binding protein